MGEQDHVLCLQQSSTPWTRVTSLECWLHVLMAPLLSSEDLVVQNLRIGFACYIGMLMWMNQATVLPYLKCLVVLWKLNCFNVQLHSSLPVLLMNYRKHPQYGRQPVPMTILLGICLEAQLPSEHLCHSRVDFLVFNGSVTC